MLKLLIDYPTKDEEMEIIRRNTEPGHAHGAKAMTGAEILKMQAFTKSVYADDKVKKYVTSLVDASRNPKEYGLDLAGMIEYGASPRASIWLIMAGKASAVMQGRGYVLPEDIRGIAHDVLRHRILVTFEAEAEGVTSDRIIDMILDKVRVP
jgi:MoxR-like ATPase